jgi:iron complex outermembrane receptor protein
MSYGYRMFSAALLTGSALTSPALASAQAVAPAPDVQVKPAAQDQSPGDIVVTATRREQRLQDVPLAVTAISGDALEKTNYTSITDVQYLSPGVTFSTNPSSDGGGFAIRGVGTQAYNYGTEQTVGVVVDGVVIGMPRDPGATGFADLERIEVLRGPQGTLFGKNASAGVISIVTRKPQIGVTSVDGYAALGSRNETILRGAVNAGLSSTSALRVSGYYQGQDGGVPAYFHDWHAGDRKSWGVRGRFLWEPTDRLSVTLNAEYQHIFTRDAFSIASFGPNPLYSSLFAQFAVQPSRDHPIAYQDGDWFARSSVYGFSGEINYQLGEHTLTSITAYRHMSLNQTDDPDGAPINIFNFNQTLNHDRQITQELRLTSPSGGALEYVIGAYYYDVRVRADETAYGNFFTPNLLFSFTGGTAHYDVRTKSVALFGQGTYRLAAPLRLVLGLRYTHDDVSADIGLTPIAGLLPLGPFIIPTSGRVRNDNVSGRVGLQYDVAPDVMAYATYARGYKGPSINVLLGVAQALRPETVDSFEAGVKATVLDRKLSINLALYTSKFKDFQAQVADLTVVPPALVLANAGGLRVRGVELELNARPTHALTLGASVAYNQAVYTDFTSFCYTGQPISGAAGVGCYALPSGANVANLAGTQLPNAPEWNLTGRFDYTRPIGGGLALNASANVSWRSATLSQEGNPNTRTDPYALVNATLGIGGERGQWRVGIYARNLFNQRFRLITPSYIDTGGFNQVVPSAAFRTIGGFVGFHF